LRVTCSLRDQFLVPAYNRLGSTFALRADSGAGLVPVVLPRADVEVEELRAEAFAKVSRPLGPRFSLEAEMAVEAAEISVAGEETFLYTHS